MKLVAVVVAHDEMQNIGRCLASVAGLCPVVVVDSGSRDGTQAFCRSQGATVVEHAYESHARQWQWILEQPFAREADWLLALDADFAVETALRRALEQRLPRVADPVAGIYVRHLYHFGGGVIRYGGTKQHWLRLVRPSRASADQGDLVDFRFRVDGSTETWPEAVVEHNLHDEDLSFWLAKQDKFALRLAVEEELRRRRLHGWQGEPRFFGNPDQRTMWLRDRWLSLPLYLRPVLYWLYRYLLALGFLDGRAGFLYHTLQGLLLRLMVDWKIGELRRAGLDDARLGKLAEAMLQVRGGSVRALLQDGARG